MNVVQYRTVGILKPTHTCREIRLRNFQKQMVVVVSQNKRMNLKPSPLANLSQRSQNGLPVFVIENNIPTKLYYEVMSIINSAPFS